jgi:hypothetical protein
MDVTNVISRQYQGPGMTHFSVKTCFAFTAGLRWNWCFWYSGVGQNPVFHETLVNSIGDTLTSVEVPEEKKEGICMKVMYKYCV